MGLHTKKTGSHPRHYCPVCGTVRQAYKHWMKGWIVEEHDYMTTDKWHIEHCPGGSINEKGDRAP